MQSTFEKLGGTYRQAGDYLLPDVEVPKNPAIGIWGQRHFKARFIANYIDAGFTCCTPDA